MLFLLGMTFISFKTRTPFLARKTLKNWSLLLLLSILAFSSCRRESLQPTNPDNHFPDTRSPELTGNNIKLWRIDNITLNDTIVETIDTCNLDDTYAFHFNGKLELNNGLEKCTDEEDIIEIFWELQQEKSLIQFTYPTGQLAVFEILELNNQRFVISGNAFSTSGEYIGQRTLLFNSLE